MKLNVKAISLAGASLIAFLGLLLFLLVPFQRLLLKPVEPPLTEPKSSPREQVEFEAGELFWQSKRTEEARLKLSQEAEAGFRQVPIEEAMARVVELGRWDLTKEGSEK